MNKLLRRRRRRRPRPALPPIPALLCAAFHALQIERFRKPTEAQSNLECATKGENRAYAPQSKPLVADRTTSNHRGFFPYLFSDEQVYDTNEMSDTGAL